MTTDFQAATEALRRLPQAEVIALLQPLMRPARFNTGSWGSGEGEHPDFAPYFFDERGNRYDVLRSGGDWNGPGRITEVSRWLTPAFDPSYAGGVYGAYVGVWREDGTPVGVVFRQQERHGGFLAENLEWIGPLAVAAFAAFGPGLLSPYTVTEAASTAASGGSNVLDDVIDWVDDYGDWSMPDFSDIAPPLSPIEAAPILESTPSWLPPTPAPPPVLSTPGWTLPNIGDIFAGIPDVVKGATAAARQALQLVSTVRAVQQVIEGPQAGAARRIARPDGTVLITDPGGRSRIERPPPGVAQPMPDGGFLVNNGDGTYTRIYADGRRQVLRYGQPSGPYGAAGPSMDAGGLLSNPWVLVGGAAVAGLLLARTFRR